MPDLPHPGPPLAQHTRRLRSRLRPSGQFLGTRAMDSVPHDVTVTEDEHANSGPNDATDRPEMVADLQVSDLPHPVPPLAQHTRHPRSPFRPPGQFLGTRALDSVPHDVAVTEEERANSRSNDAADRPQADVNVQVSDLPHPGPSLAQHTRRLRSLLRSSGQFPGTHAMDSVPHDVTVTEDRRANSGPTDATDRPQTDVGLQVSDLPHRRPPLAQQIRHPRSLFRSFGQFLGTRTVDGVPHDVAVNQSIYHVHGDLRAADGQLISDLCKRVQHLADTCNDPGLFTSPDLLQKRVRGCVKTIASLVLCANVKPELFGGLASGEQLRKLGEIAKIHEPLAVGSDTSFLAHWACLYLVVVTRRTLEHPSISSPARNAIRSLSALRLEDGGEQTNIEDDDHYEHVLKVAQTIDGHFETARQFCVGVLKRGFGSDQEGRTEEQVGEVLGRDHEADISMLESATPSQASAAQMRYIDIHFSKINCAIDHASLFGVSFDEFTPTGLINPAQFFNISASDAQVFMPQIVFLDQRLRLLCSYAPKLRRIMNGQGDGVYQETLESLRILWDQNDLSRRSVVGRRHLMGRQLWRLLDLRDAGGFGFLVELFLLMLTQLLSMSSSQDTHSILYVGTFQVITSCWKQHKHSIGTKRVILNVICDIAISNRGIFSNRTYPESILNELLDLLGNIVEEESGSYIDETMKELGENIFRSGGTMFATQAMDVISRKRAQVPVFS